MLMHLLHHGQRQIIRAAAAISAGLRREHNEDSFYLNGTSLGAEEVAAVDRSINRFDPPDGAARSMLLGVFDGMGGESYGELASAMSAAAMKRLHLELRLMPFFPEERCLTRFFARADAQVTRKADELGAGCVGSTGAVVWLDGGTVAAANMGDSRIYLVRGGRLRRLSHDHTATQMRIDCGELTAGEAAALPRSHAIGMYIGMGGVGTRFAPYLRRPFSTKPGDLFLLCSDGLTDMVDDEALLAAVLAGDDPAELCARLTGAALEAGGRDNITVIAARVETEQS